MNMQIHYIIELLLVNLCLYTKNMVGFSVYLNIIGELLRITSSITSILIIFITSIIYI